MKWSFVKTLREIALRDDRLFLLTGDLGFGLFDEFRSSFPRRFINVGVAEANMIGIAAGLALSGKNVYCYSIIPFLTMRCLERIRVDLCRHNLSVKLVGAGGGLVYGLEGMTHHATEDMAIMRSLPNMTVVAPGDQLEVEAVTRESATYQGPLYIRLGGRSESPIHTSVPDLRIGKAIVLGERGDTAIIATGTMLQTAKVISDRLLEEGIHACPISMHTVKPLDRDMIESLARESTAIFTMEEHSVVGGLGSAVAEILVETGYRGLFRRIGLPDEYGRFIGKRDYLLAKYRLAPEAIQEFILQELNGRPSSSEVGRLL